MLLENDPINSETPTVKSASDLVDEINLGEFDIYEFNSPTKSDADSTADSEKEETETQITSKARQEERLRKKQARRIIDNYLQEPRLGHGIATSPNKRFALLMNLSNEALQLLPFWKQRYEG